MNELSNAGTITDHQSLKEYFGELHHLDVVVEKIHLHDLHKRFIALSPFRWLASASADDQPSVSPRGGTPVSNAEAQALIEKEYEENLY
tara:strand:+ start:151 stop:417 length:267 start_codon:yes stop_codon:yes gene_type:complete